MKTCLLGSIKARWADTTLVAVFLLFIGLPWVVQRLDLSLGPTLNERRKLAPHPHLSWTWRALADYPGQFDKYYNDHFGLRNYLVRGYNIFMVRQLASSPKEDVILGKDGWLFYGAKNAVDVFRSPVPLTDQELDEWRWNLLLRREWLARQGIPYLVVIAPDKATIYPEYLPDWLVPACPQTRTDQLVNFLTQTTDLDVVDLRPVLRAAKGPRLLYHKTDTHWNELGAFVGYHGIVERMALRVPSIQPLELSDYTIRPSHRILGDLAGMISMNDYFPEEYPSLVANFPLQATLTNTHISAEEWSRLRVYTAFASETGDRRQPRVVVFNDSYFYGIIPYFAENFSRAVYIHIRPDHFAPDVVERERPDVVVQEMVERWFGRMPDQEEKLF